MGDAGPNYSGLAYSGAVPGRWWDLSPFCMNGGGFAIGVSTANFQPMWSGTCNRIKAVKLGYAANIADTGGNVWTFGLYADASTMPGALIGQLAQGTVASATLGQAFTFTCDYPLTPYTVYWICALLNYGSNPTMYTYRGNHPYFTYADSLVQSTSGSNAISGYYMSGQTSLPAVFGTVAYSQVGLRLSVLLDKV